MAGLAAALIWTLHDSSASASTGSNSGTGTQSSTSLSSGGSGAASTSASASAAAAPTGGSGGGGGQAQSFLTTAGARSLVSALNQQFGSRKVITLDVYPDYAAVEVETAADQTLYDEYWYRNGTFETVSHGTVTDELPVDLGAVDWNVLPKLLSDATQQLKVPHPTSTYLIIEGNFIGNGPGLAVYLSDDYGSGYLLADLKGNVLKTYPRGS